MSGAWIRFGPLVITRSLAEPCLSYTVAQSPVNLSCKLLSQFLRGQRTGSHWAHRAGPIAEGPSTNVGFAICHYRSLSAVCRDVAHDYADISNRSRQSPVSSCQPQQSSGPGTFTSKTYALPNNTSTSLQFYCCCMNPSHTVSCLRLLQ